MELEKFIQYFGEQIKYEADAAVIPMREAFFKITTEMLIDGEEIFDFEYLPFEGIGRQGKKIQIDGYSYDEVDEVLSLFIAPPLSDFSNELLSSADINKLFERMSTFIRDYTVVLQNAEESAPGYGLAYNIGTIYKFVKKYRLIIVSDRRKSKLINIIKDSEINGRPVEYQIWDVDRFYILAESETSREDIEIDLTKYLEKGLACLPASETEDFKAFLCNVPGIVLAELYNTYGSRLLEGNVRSFLQTKGKVNKGIRATILNDPSKFFAYNNGIAATANVAEIKDVDGQKYITKLIDLQIVNGGQTTASLGSALLNDKKERSEEKIRDVYVPMKLSIVSHEKAQELIPMISRFANTQNKVSDSDLASNHPFHVRMEEASRRISTPAVEGKQYGTKWYYERANGQYKQETYKAKDTDRKKFELSNPKKQLFKKVDLAKYMNIHHQLPHIVSQGNQKSFLKFSEWVVSEWEKNDLQFNDDYFRNIISMAILFRETDRIVKSQKWYTGSYKANVVAYTLSKIFQLIQVKEKEKTIDLKPIWQKQSISEGWERQIVITAEIMYNHLINEKRQVENVTEWAKRVDCWRQAQDINIPIVSQFSDELIYKSEFNQQKDDARKDQKLAKDLSYVVQVYDYGVANWKYLLQWGNERKIFNPKEQDLIKVATSIDRGRIPSDRQCKVILDILEKARLEGYPK